jgi:TonB-like protein
MTDVHAKDTKVSPRMWRDLRALCGGVLFLSLTVTSVAAQTATEKQKIICDHAAPPRGMHYVCKSQCDCHLEGKLRNDDAVAPGPTAPDGTNEPKVCKYDAPETGELLICDSKCNCEPFKKPKASACKSPMSVVVPPDYPILARGNRFERVVFLDVEIAGDGSVTSAKSTESPHNGLEGLLAKAAENSVMKWRFDPDCSRVQTVDVRFRVSADNDSDPPGFYVHPPDEVEVVAAALVVSETSSAHPKKRSKKAKEQTPTSK